MSMIEPIQAAAGEGACDHHDEYLDDDCGNCGGEGWTYDCFDGCCVDAEDGCDLCRRRGDWCNPAGRVRRAR